MDVENVDAVFMANVDFDGRMLGHILIAGRKANL
jgi:hypothetical protein